MPIKNETWLFVSRPSGVFESSSLSLEEISFPDPMKGELLLKTTYISVDPYMRNRMNNVRSYVAPFEIGKPMSGDVVAEVLESKDQRFKRGDVVTGSLPWSRYITVPAKHLEKITNPDEAPDWLGVYGLTGLTAYFGLKEIGKPARGETVVISGAGGAVGSIAGQIGRICGARVIGITGSDRKAQLLKETLGFDEVINYKTVPNVRKSVARVCPDGVDVYFDNVGGEISDAVLYRINDYARIVLCGQISQYNMNRIPVGPRLNALLLVHRALMQGFIVYDYRKKFMQAREELRDWVHSGELFPVTEIRHGFDQLPAAFSGLFTGENTGKMIVRI